MKTAFRLPIGASIALVVLAGLTTKASSLRAAGGSPSAEASCSTDSTLCLQEGRFLVQAIWTKPDGSSGTAHAVNLGSDSGYFWFLEPDNIELVVKTLNACSVNGHHYWFFAGGLTNLEVAITVTDTTTNEVKHYSNAQGAAFLPITDTNAFGCPAGAEALEAHNPEEPPENDLTTMSVAAPADSGCAEDETTLCISGRFQVKATWETASGKSGSAHAVSLTSESGYFWFFDPSNVEMLVKTLDACGLGKGQWFFAAGLTTVGVQIHVTDTFTGEAKDYGNPLGSKFLPIQDTSAFAFCPTPTPTATSTATPPTLTPTPTSALSPTLRPTTHTPRPTPTPTPTPTPQVHAVSLVCVSESCNNHNGTRCVFNFPSPSTIHIRIGDTITWYWSYGVHSISSGTVPNPNGNFDSGTQTGPFTFSHTFTRIGTFPYFCSPGHERAFRDPAGPCLVYLGHESGVVIVDP